MKIKIKNIIDDQKYHTRLFWELRQIPNLISLLRIILIPFIWVSFSQQQEKVYLTFFLIGLSGISDYFDGFFAKRFNIHTRAGLFLDPIADKLTFAIISIALYLYRDMPLWVPIFLILKDIIILLFAFLLKIKYSKMATSNEFGRYTTVVLFISFMLFTIRIQPFAYYLLYLSIIGVIVSMISYIFNYIKVVRHE